MPRPRMTMLRLAIANIHRPGALTPSVVLSLGLGLTVLVTITQIDRNLQRQFMAQLPEKAPSFFFVDIPTADADRFDAFLAERVPGGKIERVPMLRGRIVEARGLKAEELKPSPDAAWVLQSDRGLTYTGDIPSGSKVVEGELVGSGLWRSAAGLVREEACRRPRPEARRQRHRECARPQRHRQDRQHAHRRLAEPRHQLRAGVLAQRVSRRPAHPYRDPDRAELAARRATRRSSRRWRTPFRA